MERHADCARPTLRDSWLPRQIRNGLPARRGKQNYPCDGRHLNGLTDAVTGRASKRCAGSKLQRDERTPYVYPVIKTWRQGRVFRTAMALVCFI